MGDPISIALAIGAAASVAGTGYSIHQGEKQREAIETEKGRAGARADQQRQAMEKEKADALAREASLGQQAARRRVGPYRAGTVLTSPQGASTTLGTTPTGKTILGA